MGIAKIFESGDKAQQKGHFRNLVMIARADGSVSESEKTLLTKIASRIGLTEEQVAEIKANPENYPTVPPINREERYDRFVRLMQLALADGAASEEEKIVVRKYAVAIGFTEESLNAKFDVVLEKLKSGKSRSEVVEEIL